MKHLLKLCSFVLLCTLTLCPLLACGKNNPVEVSTDTTAPTTEPETEPDTESKTEPETEPEIEVPTWAPPSEEKLGLANVALGCPVITNDCMNASNQNLTDGDPTTDYSTERYRETEMRTFPYEVVVDLTRSYPVSGIRIRNSEKNASYGYQEFKVEVSEDGITYTQVATHANATETNVGLELTFDASARFVRIVSTDIGKKSAYRITYAELEVLSEITNYDNLLPNKRALVMQPGATDVLTASYRLSGEGNIRFHSSDSAVVTVDEVSGAVTAVGNGEASLYITDGKNCTPVPVTVKTPVPAYRISTFYLPNCAPVTREGMAQLKEAGIQYLENCRAYDKFGNLTTEYIRVWAADYGMTASICDPVHGTAWLEKTDEEIRAIVAKYKNLPGFGGMYILDEPLYANQYARVYNAMLAEDPFCLPHLNLLPGGMTDFHGYVSDYVATVGGDNLKSLSYDNYPFGVAPGSFNTLVYNTLDEIRKTGLAYGVDTGYYIHAMGIHNAYRVPTDSEMLYHTALGVAYGMKDFKWFVWYTPPYSGSGEHFITGIISPDGTESEIYGGVKAANALLGTLSPYLANTNAAEVYHTGQNEGTALPSDFCIQPAASARLVISVLVDKESGCQYLVVVNKAMNDAKSVSFTLTDIALTTLTDLTSGKASDVTIQNGSFTLDLPAGGLCLLALPESYDARCVTPVSENDGTSESLLHGHGASVSSSVGMGTFAYMLTDGKLTSTGWATDDATAETAWIVYDLKQPKTFNRVDIYPLGDTSFMGICFPKALSVWVSNDGKTYREIASRTDIDVFAWESITFEETTARYIRISIDRMSTILSKPHAEIGEIEVYLDKGNIPAMPSFKVEKHEPAANGNLILKTPFYVSSSYEEYGWTKNVINDGRTDYAEGVHQGWNSAIGAQVPECNEWVLFPLGTPTTVQKMVIYPVGTFVADYHVEVSTDGFNWTTVASVTGDDYKQKGTRTLTFDPVEATYIRLVITKMGVKSSMAAVGYTVAISEIEVY